MQSQVDTGTLLSEIQTTLLEPVVDGGQTWGSLIWTREEVLDALNAAVRGLVHDTHIDVARAELPNITSGIVVLPCDWIATASVAWRDNTSGARTPLGPADDFESDLAFPAWESTPGLPLGYFDRSTRDLQPSDQRLMRLVPPPAQGGVVELLYVRLPPTLVAPTSGQPERIPLTDECIPGIKYSTLGTLLRKLGRLLDDERALYCERQYELTKVAVDIILGGWA